MVFIEGKQVPSLLARKIKLIHNEEWHGFSDLTAYIGLHQLNFHHPSSFARLIRRNRSTSQLLHRLATIYSPGYIIADHFLV